MRIDLLKKIAAMAHDSGGNAGERKNAIAKLEAMLEKEGHTLDDLESLLQEQKLMWVKFPYSDPYEQKLATQCVCHLINTIQVHNKVFEGDHVEFKLLVSRASEIRSFVERVILAYRVDLRNFQQAFLHKQNLFVKADAAKKKEDTNGEGSSDPPEDPLSSEDRAHIVHMMKVIGKVVHIKMLD